MRYLILFFTIFFIFFSPDSIAQTYTVKGAVFSKADNTSIPYATIAHKSTGIGILANENGTFRINNVHIPGDTLLISAIGYRNIEWVANLSDTNLMQYIYLQALIYHLQTAEIKGIRSPEQLRQAILNMKLAKEPPKLQGVKQYKGSLHPQAPTVMSPISLIYNSKMARKHRAKKWSTQITMPE